MKIKVPKHIFVNESGGCVQITFKFESNSTKRKLSVDAADALDLCWSPLGYAVVYEVYSHTKSLIHSLKQQSSEESSEMQAGTPFEIRVDSEHTVALDFQLPNKHTMRWIVPSLHFERSPTRILLSAPTFLLELDSHILMTLEVISIFK